MSIVEGATSYATVASMAVTLPYAQLDPISPSTTVISTLRSVKDIDADGAKLYSQSFVVDEIQNTIATLPLPAVEVVKPAFTSRLPTDSGAIEVRGFNLESNGKPRIVLEVLLSGVLTRRFDVTTFHGKFVADDWFGGSAISSTREFVVYVAGVKKTDPTTYFDSPSLEISPSSANANANESSTCFASTKFDYTPDWGEKFGDVNALGVYICHLRSGAVVKLSGVPPNTTPGQPVFTPDGRGVVYTAWSDAPIRRGMIYCFQRRCSVYCAPIAGDLEAINAFTNQCKHATFDAFLKANNSANNAPVTVTSPSPYVCLTEPCKLARSPRFSPCGKHLVFLGSRSGYNTHGGCSELFTMDWFGTNPSESEMNIVSSVDGSDSSKAVDAAYIHSVLSRCLPTLRCLVPEVMCASTAKQRGFPGLYTPSLAPQSICFIQVDAMHPDSSSDKSSAPDNNRSMNKVTYLLLESSWHFFNVLLAVDIRSGLLLYIDVATGRVVPLIDEDTPSHGDGKISLSNVDSMLRQSLLSVSLLTSSSSQDGKAKVLLLASSPNSQGRLVLLTSQGLCALENTSGDCLNDFRVACSETVQPMAITAKYNTVITTEYAKKVGEDVNGLKAVVLDIVPSDISHNSEPFEAMLIYPEHSAGISGDAAEGEPLPLIVVPHGGPHATFSSAFMISHAFLATSCCAAVLLVNFRGSTGYGRLALESLAGRIGSQDVSDVIDAVKAALTYKSKDTEPRPLLDKDRVAVVGGSHGGFLAAHLSSRYKDVFKVAALRNPVINIPAMYTTSDIPDWCVIESMGTDAFNFDACDFASPEAMQRMRDASPCVHAHEVSAPSLLCLGMKDRRVPYSQGLEYYNCLKSRGVTVDLRMYPEDCHAIDKPTSEADQFISIRNWLAKYM